MPLLGPGCTLLPGSSRANLGQILSESCSGMQLNQCSLLQAARGAKPKRGKPGRRGMFAPAAKGLDRAGSKLGKRRRTEYLDVDYVMPAMPGARIVPAVVSAVAGLAICCCHPQACALRLFQTGRSICCCHSQACALPLFQTAH